MVTGSIVGWDAWVTPKEGLAATHEIFRIELCREDKSGVGTTLKLPATAFEIADTLAKLRITDGDTPYQSEFLGYELDCLHELIPDDPTFMS